RDTAKMRKTKYKALTSKAGRPRLTSLRELTETLQAIRKGRVDAVVVAGPNGDQVYTLQGAEHPYRVLVEAMKEGATTLDLSRVVLYCNKRFGEILGAPLEKLIGTRLVKYVAKGREADKLDKLLADGQGKTARGEISTVLPGGRRLQVRLSLNPVKDPALN